MLWACRNLPWHKVTLQQDILTSPNDWKIVLCSCGKKYVVTHSAKKFFKWTPAVGEFYEDATVSDIARFELTLLQTDDAVKRMKLLKKGKN